MKAKDDQRYRIRVSVRSDYLPEQSRSTERRYAFSYTVTIENLGTEAAQLLDRHWVITDTDGKVQEVRGEGVVGEKPYLKPGQSFRYTSGTLLETPVGSMHGSYGMIADDGTRFDAEIPPFSLAIPKTLH
jgi:ApaG protein